MLFRMSCISQPLGERPSAGWWAASHCLGTRESHAPTCSEMMANSCSFWTTIQLLYQFLTLFTIFIVLLSKFKTTSPKARDLLDFRGIFFQFDLQSAKSARHFRQQGFWQRSAPRNRIKHHKAPVCKEWSTVEHQALQQVLGNLAKGSERDFLLPKTGGVKGWNMG